MTNLALFLLLLLKIIFLKEFFILKTNDFNESFALLVALPSKNQLF